MLSDSTSDSFKGYRLLRKNSALKFFHNFCDGSGFAAVNAPNTNFIFTNLQKLLIMTNLIKSLKASAKVLGITSIFTIIFAFPLHAQLKVGNNPTTINSNSALEVESTTKGFLPPRVALTITTSPAPLANHVKGMLVYNTAVVNDVSEGLYQNDGTKWAKLITQTSQDGSLDLGARKAFHKAWPISTPDGSFLSSYFNSDLLVFEGLKMDAYKASWEFWVPVIYNTTGSPITISLNNASTITGTKRLTSYSIPAYSYVTIDFDDYLDWVSRQEVANANIAVNGRWYVASWWAITEGSYHKIYMSLTRLY